MDGNDDGEVLDLTGSPDRLVRVAGVDNPIPASQLLHKAAFIQSTQAYAEREKALRNEFSEAAGIVEYMQTDPLGFHQELTEKLQQAGLTPRQAEEKAQQITQGVEQPQMTMDSSGEWKPEINALKESFESLTKLIFEKEANQAIGSEIGQAQDIERQLGGLGLSTQDLQEVIALAQQRGTNDLVNAYQLWKFPKLIEERRKLNEELTVTRRKAEYPMLGSGSEAHLSQTKKPSRTPAQRLQEKIDALGL